MSDLWNEYLELHPFDFELVPQGDTRYVFRITQSERTPTKVPVIFGEWLYNLRSALDYIVWAAAVRTTGSAPPPGEGGGSKAPNSIRARKSKAVPTNGKSAPGYGATINWRSVKSVSHRPSATERAPSREPPDA